MKIEFVLNGKPVTAELPGDRRLLDALREDFGLTGTKEGCGQGECGTCTVIVNGEAVHSCLTLMGQVDGAEVLTIEGLDREGELSAIQKAFVKRGAVQCGFCTAGIIMSAKALLMKNPDPTLEEINRALAGNICRCGGYREIRAAVLDAAAAGKEA